MGALIFTEVDELVEALGDRVDQPTIVGIDGWTGVGKTTLAKSLAEAMGGRAYDLDSALNRDQRAYTSALRLHEIADEVALSTGLLLVSGVCLRQVLQDAERSADLHIYIKRMAAWGWAEEDEIAGIDFPEFPGASGEILRQEMRLYHRKWQPELRADYEFHRFG
jgi:hypothetical protein